MSENEGREGKDMIKSGVKGIVIVLRVFYFLNSHFYTKIRYRYRYIAAK